jgi:hypothetical protein
MRGAARNPRCTDGGLYDALAFDRKPQIRCVSNGMALSASLKPSQ